MKKAVAFLTLLFFVSSSPLPLYPTSKAVTDYDCYVNDEEDNCGPLGHGSDQATFTTVSMSMIGWGLGLAAAIAILAGVIHQSTATSHTDSNNNGS